MSSKNMITEEALRSGFERLGMKNGGFYIVHVALSSFGHIHGGAPVLLEVLKAIITSEGILGLPTFTYGKDAFSNEGTPSQTGKVSECFRLMPGVTRSDHPTHSWALWGDRSKEFAAGHCTESAFQENSPLVRLAHAGAVVVLVGVNHTANSLIHAAQEAAKVPYLDRPKDVAIVEKSATLRTMRVRRSGCSLGFQKIEPFVVGSQLHKGQVGESMVQLFNAEVFLVQATDLLKKNPLALVCDRTGCFACDEARQMCKGLEAENSV